MQTSKATKNIQYFQYVVIGVKYYKKRVSGQSNIKARIQKQWQKQQQGI